MIALAASVVVGPLVVGWEPGRVEARRYGHRNYHKRRYNYSAYINRCKRGCTGTASILKHCVTTKQLRAGIAQCRDTRTQARTDCAGDATCRRDTQRAYKSCRAAVVASARNEIKTYGPKRCARCCQRTHGSGSCLSYLSGSRWYGSYRAYGKTSCVVNGSTRGSPSGAFPLGFSDRLRARLATLVPALTSGWSQ